MKKEKIIFIIMVFCIFTFSIFSMNIINAKIYNNNEKNKEYTNVKGAKDELYADSYSTVNTRVTALESRAYESGSSGNWKWKKYADGTFDMWIKGSFTATHYQTWNNFYSYKAQFTFPSAMKPINSSYTVNSSHYVGTGFSIDSGVNGRSTTGFTFYVHASQSGSQTVYYKLHIHGLWK